MRRVFDLDVLACPRCGGRLLLIATVEDPAVVGKGARGAEGGLTLASTHSRLRSGEVNGK